MMRFFKDSKMLLFLALPLLFSRFVDMAVFFVGFILIAKLGTVQFAASALASSVYVTTIVVAMGILYAMGIKMSFAFGEKDNKKIREYFYGGTLLAVLLSVAAVIIISFIAFLLPYLGQKAELVPAAKRFMYVLCIPMLPTLLTIVVNQLVTVLLKPRIVFITSVVNAVVTVSCFYPLIFGGFGLPALGVWGFGLSLLIGNVFVVLITLAYVMQVAHFRSFEIFKLAGLGKQIFTRIMEIVRLGLPMGIQFGAEIAAFSVTTFLIGFFGVNALIAAQIAQQIIVVVLAIPFTFSEATAILVGQSAGNKDVVAVRSYGFSSQKLIILFLSTVAIILFSFPQLLAGIYIDVNNPEMVSVVSLSVLFLYVAAVSQIFDGMRNTVSGALRALNDSKYPMYVGIFIMWCIGLPIGIVLAFLGNWGPIGFPIGAAIAFFIGAVILIARFNKKTKTFGEVAVLEQSVAAS